MSKEYLMMKHTKLNVGTKGHIALQLHKNDELLIRYRKIYIRKICPKISNR